MKNSILITRPALDAEMLAKKLQQQGFTPIIMPMMEVTFLPNAPLPDHHIGGLIFTSANGVRALMHRLQNHHALWQKLQTMPLYAVGTKTAQTAKNNGFTNILTASGNVDTLYQLICNHADKNAKLYHGAADNHPHSLAEKLNQTGFHTKRVSLYQTIAVASLPDNFADILPQLYAVMLFSPRTAEIFMKNFYNHTLQNHLKYTISFVCLSQAVCDMVKKHVEKWQKQNINIAVDTKIADISSDDAMIEILKWT
ncbi:MAG: uroporphyrinogen-III synthase [Alphaproteobacteria bacterium]|nr:uroporphyrinogen-III synthase [Alphaproteobacteria bacterium]